MKNLDTPERQQAAVAEAKSFIMHPFWSILVEIVKNDVSLLKNRLATEEFEDISEIKTIQQKIIAYQDVIGTPLMIIEKYDPDFNAPTPDENPDPFETIEEFRLNMKKQRKSS